MGWFTKKKKNNRTISDEQRESSLETRKLNSEIKKLKQEIEIQKIKEQAEIDKLKLEKQKMELEESLGYYDEDDEEIEQSQDLLSPELSLIMSMMGKFQGVQNNSENPPTTNEQEQQNALISLSDEEQNHILQSFDKKQIKKFKAMPDSLIKKFAMQQYPMVEPASIDAMISKFRSS